MEVVFNNKFGLLIWTPSEDVVAYAREIGAPDEEFQAMIMHMFGLPLQMMMGAVSSGSMSHPTLMRLLSEDLTHNMKLVLEAHGARLQG